MYLNQAGNSFSDRKRIDSFPQLDELNSLSVLDILGNGTSCLVWSSPFSRLYTTHTGYLDFVQGKKPRLVTKIDDNRGYATHVHYEPSTKFYLQDKDAGRP
jgi:hypothetical protein